MGSYRGERWFCSVAAALTVEGELNMVGKPVRGSADGCAGKADADRVLLGPGNLVRHTVRSVGCFKSRPWSFAWGLKEVHC